MFLKKMLLLVLLLIAAAFNLSCWPSLVLAKSYSINQVQITAQLQADGSMQVVEEREYQFDGQYAYAYQDINLVPDQSANPGRTLAYELTDVQVCEAEFCYQQLPASQVDQEQPRANPVQSFYIQQNGDQLHIQWFYRAVDEKRRFQLRYTVKNAVTWHSDVAELYWQWVGDQWALDQNNVQVTLQLPAGIIDEQLQAWVHGPLDGQVAIPNLEQLNFKVDHLPAGKFFEGRVLMNQGAFAATQSAQFATGNFSRSQIQSQEAEFIAQTKKQVQQGWLWLAISLGLHILAGVIFIKELIKFWRDGKDRRLPKINPTNTLWEPPSELEPTQVMQLLRGNKSLLPRAFTAMVLSLVQARAAKIIRSKEKTGLIFKDYEYGLEKTNRQVKLTKLQQQVYDFIFKRVGSGKKQLWFNKLVKYCRRHHHAVRRFFKSLERLSFQISLKQGWFERSAHQQAQDYKGVVGLFLVGLAQIGVSAWSSSQEIAVIMPLVMLSCVLGAVLAIGLFIIALIFKSQGEKRTEKGRQEAAKWQAFKNHLQDYQKTKNYPIDSIILWENYLVYGTALGVSTKALSQLPVSFNQSDSRSMNSYWAAGALAQDGVGQASSGVTQVASITESLGSVSKALSALSTAASSS
ncbi:MAG: DUF2207 domain-containing protein, partial [Candidatus Pacebacteria bacterium]|nr:DUF2207 domain-containing protein [Candidatus Paceibacterota bacterium]